MIEIKVPDLGENIEKAEVLKVLVAAGDTVRVDQSVLELETDKAAFELPSPHAGVVSAVRVRAGDAVSVGQTVLTLEPAASSATAGPVATARPEAAARPEPPAAAPQQRPTPEAPRAPQPPTASPPPRVAPPPVSVPASLAPAAGVPPAAGPAPSSGFAAAAGVPPAAGPATRRLARELGMDIRTVRGSGPGGRITKDDVKASVRARQAGEAAGSGAGELPDFSQWGAVERRKMSKLGRTAAERLSQAWRTIPHVTQHDLADITALDAARRRHDENRDPSEPRLTMTVLAIKAVVATLKEFPHFNSSFDAGAGEVVYKRYYNIGVAVDTEHGLLVPVVKNADRKSLPEIAAELEDLAARARERRLQIEEMQGGTFTITNLGGLGGVYFTPIINPPEVAILGISRARREPVLREGQIEEQLRLPLSLSYDHRVVNGADAVRFLNRLIGLLEDPIGLLLEN